MNVQNPQYKDAKKLFDFLIKELYNTLGQLGQKKRKPKYD